MPRVKEQKSDYKYPGWVRLWCNRESPMLWWQCKLQDHFRPLSSNLLKRKLSIPPILPPSGETSMLRGWKKQVEEFCVQPDAVYVE